MQTHKNEKDLDKIVKVFYNGVDKAKHHTHRTCTPHACSMDKRGERFLIAPIGMQLFALYSTRGRLSSRFAKIFPRVPRGRRDAARKQKKKEETERGRNNGRAPADLSSFLTLSNHTKSSFVRPQQIFRATKHKYKENLRGRANCGRGAERT